MLVAIQTGVSVEEESVCTLTNKMDIASNLFFFFFATPVVRGSSWARDPTQTTAAIQVPAVTMLENYTAPTAPQKNSYKKAIFESTK